MKPRKDQTEEQRIMRDMGVMLIRHMPNGGDMRFELKKLWRICPHGYKNFNSFYISTYVHASKTING